MTRAICVLLSFVLFAGCQAEEPELEPVPFDAAPWIEQGTSAAATTFSIMRARLEQTIASDGVEGALQYCNVKAYPLTDSLSNVLSAQIRRTSLKPRNPDNAPSERERAVLEEYQAAIDAGLVPEPRAVRAADGRVFFHAPIITKPVCTSCHGIPGQTLTDESLALIRSLYPDDQAYGYGVEQLRGMWSITFDGD